MSTERKICDICGNELTCSWTDTHGIAQCLKCGAPYRLYFYDENNKRIEKPVECLIAKDWILICKKFWEENKRPMPSGCSFPGGQEVANQNDMKAWDKWIEEYTNKEIQGK